MPDIFYILLTYILRVGTVITPIFQLCPCSTCELGDCEGLDTDPSEMLTFSCTMILATGSYFICTSKVRFCVHAQSLSRLQLFAAHGP